jgi:hypothetical protein
LRLSERLEAARPPGSCIGAKEAEVGDLGENESEATEWRAEDFRARCVCEHQGQGNKDGGQVEQHLGRIDSCQPGDQGVNAMPEGKDIAWVEPAVLELVDGGQRRKGIELGKLSNARQMEEGVGARRARRPPHHSRIDDREPEGRRQRAQVGARGSGTCFVRSCGHEGDENHSEENQLGEHNRHAEGEDEGERNHDGCEADGQRGCDRQRGGSGPSESSQHETSRKKKNASARAR